MTPWHDHHGLLVCATCHAEKARHTEQDYSEMRPAPLHLLGECYLCGKERTPTDALLAAIAPLHDAAANLRTFSGLDAHSEYARDVARGLADQVCNLIAQAERQGTILAKYVEV